MTDYQRTTTRETRPVDAIGSTPRRAGARGGRSVRTTDTAYTPAGPGGATLAARIVTFAFGILQVLLILRIILLLLVANPGNDIVQFDLQHHPAVRRTVRRHVLAEPRDRRPGLGPRHHRDRRADRLDPRRGADPGRDPDLLAPAGRGRLTDSGTTGIGWAALSDSRPMPGGLARRAAR